MSLPRNLKKRIQLALLEHERKLTKNNYFITEGSTKLIDVPDKSLVVVLMPYPEKEAENG
ncbi:MAG: hypothetical protein ACTSQB_00260 [Candidatus Heimdallarchaeota archaeon]